MLGHTTKKQGFTLVELSIVLVIIGLLVGGVLAGKELINAARLRGVITEYNTWMQAVKIFKQKHGQIPGDFNRAAQIWPTATSGNGNGFLITTGAANAPAEPWQFWLHLQLEGLIQGSYNGLNGDFASYDAEVGLNCPPSKVNGAGWSIMTWAYLTHGSIPTTPQRNKFWFGTDSTNEWTRGGILTPVDAKNIDSKIDDGMPLRGFLHVSGYPTCTLATTYNDSAKDYNLSVNTLSCGFIFGNGKEVIF